MIFIIALLMMVGEFLKRLSWLMLLCFLLWSAYFTGTGDQFGIMTGFWMMFIWPIFLLFLYAIPLGVTFGPVLFELWWHEVPLWDVSSIAWAISGLALLARCLVTLGWYWEAKYNQ